MQVYTYAISPYEDWHRQAWAGALVLVAVRLRLLAAGALCDAAPREAADRTLTDEPRRPGLATPTHGLVSATAAQAGLATESLPTAIDVEKLSFSYGPKQALYDISLEIPANLVTAFIGPSGCGKSTFLRTLNRMNDIIPGTRVEGEVLHRRSGHLRTGTSTSSTCGAGRHGVPEVEPVSEVDLRQRRLRPAPQQDGDERAV